MFPSHITGRHQDVGKPGDIAPGCLGGLEPDLRFVHVLNWGKHRDLLPEVSGARWTTRFDDPPNYHAFSEDELE